MHFTYCPDCGEKLIDKEAGDDGYVPWCDSCQKYWFDMFPSCVIVLIANEYDEIVMIQQDYLSDRYFGYVSGYITPGETAEESAKREVLEEVGLELDELIPAGTFWFERGGQLMHGFIAKTKKKEFVLSSEVNQAKWVPIEKAEDLMHPPRPGSCLRPLRDLYLSRYGKDRDYEPDSKSG